MAQISTPQHLLVKSYEHGNKTADFIIIAFIQESSSTPDTHNVIPVNAMRKWKITNRGTLSTERLPQRRRGIR